MKIKLTNGIRERMYFEGQDDKWYKRKKRVKEDLSKFLARSSLRMELPFTKTEKIMGEAGVRSSIFCMLGLRCLLDILGRYH